MENAELIVGELSSIISIKGDCRMVKGLRFVSIYLLSFPPPLPDLNNYTASPTKQT